MMREGGLLLQLDSWVLKEGKFLVIIMEAWNLGSFLTLVESPKEHFCLVGREVIFTVIPSTW